jgi:hypothetical protein
MNREQVLANPIRAQPAKRIGPALTLPAIGRRPGHSKLDLACQLVGLICQRHPDRRAHLIYDAAYAGKALRGLACCA